MASNKLMARPAAVKPPMQSDYHVSGQKSTRPSHDTPTTHESGRDDSDALVKLLGDDYAREILAAVNEEPLSAAALADTLDMSRATVYRRLNRLRNQDLIAAETAVSSNGNHHEVFEATPCRLTVDLSGGSPTVSVDRRDDRDRRAARKTLASVN